MASKTAHQAPRALWTGTVSFGMINVPVKLYTAVREHGIHFRLLHDEDATPVQSKMVCPRHGEVHREHIIKGMEISKDRYVIVDPEEIAAAKPEATRIIQIDEFVDAGSIDPMYFDRAYYLGPGPEGAHAYRVLGDALKRTKKVGIAQFVMRGTEYLAAVRVKDGILCLDTMYFDNEVMRPDELKDELPHQKVAERELKVAQMIVESLATKFNSKQYKEEYYDRVQELIAKKARGEQIELPKEKAKPKKETASLLSTLEKSLTHVRSRRNFSDN